MYYPINWKNHRTALYCKAVFYLNTPIFLCLVLNFQKESAHISNNLLLLGKNQFA